jgi:hypothetical protein
MVTEDGGGIGIEGGVRVGWQWLHHMHRPSYSLKLPSLHSLRSLRPLLQLALFLGGDSSPTSAFF